MQITTLKIDLALRSEMSVTLDRQSRLKFGRIKIDHVLSRCQRLRSVVGVVKRLSRQVVALETRVQFPPLTPYFNLNDRILKLIRSALFFRFKHTNTAVIRQNRTQYGNDKSNPFMRPQLSGQSIWLRTRGPGVQIPPGVPISKQTRGLTITVRPLFLIKLELVC